MSKEAKIKAEIAEYEALLNDASVPQDEKDFAKEEIADLKKQLEKSGGKSPKPKKSPKEKKVKKPAKPVVTYKHKGKSIKELSKLECDELIKEIKARRESAAKSSNKSKSKPVIEKVAGNVAKAVKQAVENVPANEIDKAEINKFKRIEKAAEAFVTEMKSILGDDFNKKAVKDEFAEITSLIEKLRKKYAK